VVRQGQVDDPLVARDSEGNLAPIAQFTGDFTAWQAAQLFAGLATPEPRRARYPEGDWKEDGGTWTFRLIGGKRTYLMTLDRKYQSWRVYMMPKGKDRRATP
jgi:hypothetical protein